MVQSFPQRVCWNKLQLCQSICCQHQKLFGSSSIELVFYYGYQYKLYVNSQASAVLAVGGMTRAQATSIGITPNTLGYTTLSANTQLATLYYKGAQKQLRKITSSTVHLIESSDTSTTAGVKKVVVHESGHAFGYFGHYDRGAVMTTLYEDISSLTPSVAEKNHLKQIY